MIDFGTFIGALLGNPLLAVIFVLVLGAIVVNGATDASNAIATAVGTRSIGANAAIAIGAACDFAGLVIMSYISTAVADTISKMVNFGGNDQAALLALAAAMISIIVWGAVAWKFGIPTSQSHSLIAGLTGAAIALQGGLAGVNFAEWAKVIYGLLISTGLGFGLGWLLSRVIPMLFAHVKRHNAQKVFTGANVAAAVFLAFMHGAQDGQKFASVAMLSIALALNLGPVSGSYPMWLIVICAAFMALGCAVGGKRIIKSVAMDMTKLDKYQGFAASLSAALCLLFATLTGIPVSTTHTKTTAIMGAGSAKSLKKVKWGHAGHMVLTWVFTFPGCGLIGFVLAKLFGLFV